MENQEKVRRELQRAEENGLKSVYPQTEDSYVSGITKREYFTAFALQGLVHKFSEKLDEDGEYEDDNIDELSELAVLFAVATLESLERL